MGKSLVEKLQDFNLPKTPNLTSLRDQFCGCVIDFPKLDLLGYELIESNKSTQWKLWVKYYNRKRDGYAIKVSLDGRLGALEHVTYFDLTEDWGFMAPQGYVRFGDVSNAIKKRIEDELSQLIIKKIPSEYDEAVMYYLRMFISDIDTRLEKSPNNTKEMYLDALLANFNDKKQFDRIAYVGLGIAKFADDFIDLDFINVFGSLLGSLKYGDIYINCLRKALQRISEWNEIIYFNVGFTLRDTFLEYDLAYEVDLAAINLFPNSKRIKTNLIQSGKLVMRDKASDENDARNAVVFGEDILSKVEGIKIPCSFTMFLGLSCEAAGMVDKAEMLYQKVSECNTSSTEFHDVFRRVESKEYDPVEAKRYLSLNKFFHKTLKGVDDPLVGEINKIRGFHAS